MERWKPIPGFEHYEISNRGNVRSWLKRGYSGELRDSPVLLSPGKTHGYLFVRLRPTGKISEYKNMRINRLVLLAHIGMPPKPDYEAEHLNGNRLDNKLKNLRWATRQENVARKVKHGRPYRTRIDKGINKKLDKIQVCAIIERYKAGDCTMRSLAVEYGVSRQTICNVIHT